jgi:hypothetical protein
MKCGLCSEYTRTLFKIRVLNRGTWVTGTAEKWICKGCLKKELE